MHSRNWTGKSSALALCAALAWTWQPSAAVSAPIVETNHPNGGLIRADTSVSTGGNASGVRRVGVSTGGDGLNSIYFFQLPDPAEAASADLALEYASQDGSPTFAVDLYGLGFVSGPPTMNGAWFFEGGLDTTSRAAIGTGTSGAVSKLVDDLITTGSSTGTVTASGAAMNAFIGSLYSDGATMGDFAVFRFNSNIDLTGQSGAIGFNIGHEAPAALATLTFSPIPEPGTGSLALLGLGLALRYHRRRRGRLG